MNSEPSRDNGHKLVATQEQRRRASVRPGMAQRRADHHGDTRSTSTRFTGFALSSRMRPRIQVDDQHRNQGDGTGRAAAAMAKVLV